MGRSRKRKLPQPTPPKPSGWAHARLIVGALLVLATVTAFWPLKDNDFVHYDDPPYITDNVFVQSGLSYKSLVWAFTNTSVVGYWHPVTWLSHMADFQLFGLNPRGHHFSNLFFHLLNVLLLFLFLERTTRALWPSALVAALFALHPLRVESVAWAAERKDVLSTFFWLLTMWVYLWYTHRPSLKRYLAVVLPFALGLMAKPMLVTLPVALLLLDFWPLGRVPLTAAPAGGAASAPPGADARREVLRLLREKVPLLALAALFSLLTVVTQKRAMASLIAIAPESRVANALISYMVYLGKTIWPLNLAVFYPHPQDNVSWLLAAAAALALMGLSYLAWREAGRRPYLTMGWLWYFLTLLPVIGLLQSGEQALADRFSYVPLIGIFIIIAWGARDLTAGWPRQSLTLASAASLVLLACAILTWRQVGFWRDNQTLFEHANQVTADNHVAYTHLIYAYGEQGMVEEAKRMFDQAIKMRPRDKDAYNDLGMAYSNAGRSEEAIAMFQQTIQMAPAFAPAYNNLGIEYAKLARMEEAVAAFQKAVELSPHLVEAYNNLGKAYSLLGKTDDSIAAFKKAIEVCSYFAPSYSNLGAEYAAQGKVEDAIRLYRQAIRANPKFPDAYNNLGVAYLNQGKLAEAVLLFERSIQAQPTFMKGYSNLAVAYVDQGKVSAAAAILKKAIEINPDNQEAREMLQQLSRR